MKPRWKSEWITPAASGAVAPTGIVQARASFGPAVRYVCRPSVRKPTRISWCRPGSGWPIDSSSSRASSSGRSISSDSTFASRKTASAGATSARSSSRNAGVGQLGLVDVEHVQERLGGQQVQLAQHGRRRCRPPRRRRTAWSRRRAARAAAAAAAATGARSLRELGLLLQPRQRLLERLQVGQDQLGVDRLDVVGAARSCRRRAPRSGRRTRAPPGRSPIASRMLARNALPRPCPFDAPRTRPAMSTNDTGAGTIFCDANISASSVEPRVGQRRPRRRSARSWRTGSSRRARRSWSAR